jgi:hypothetical protein
VTLADMVENKRQNDAGLPSQIVFSPRKACASTTEAMA